MTADRLPIDPILPILSEKLRTDRSAVLVAPPGAGKTTRVPLSLLAEPWLKSARILMLEPRRLAARAAARYMASSLGERVGETVGYRIRLDTRVGPKTRIEVVTEGVLTRLLQADPALEDVGVVIFDEFHERNLHADLGLALCLQSRSVVRPDLRIVIMSATLAAQPISALLDDAPVVKSEGRAFPVETHYLAHTPSPRDVLSATVRAVLRAVNDESGDILVFLPGAGEIRYVKQRLEESSLDGVRVEPLYGNLTQRAQDRAIAPSISGERKIVLATPIAETSLTVEGVRVVVDSGLMRTPRFSPRTGMTRLETVTISQSSAEQRRGRAGRLGPGVCYRLWSRHDHRSLPVSGLPEILEADLAPLALELAAWGTLDPEELAWLDPPPPAAYRQARDLLRQLGATQDDGTISDHGRRMVQLGLHPRTAHMVLAGSRKGMGTLACELAALLGERDIVRGAGGDRSPDMRLRVEMLRAVAAGRFSAENTDASVDRSARRRVLAEVKRLRARLPADSRGQASVEKCGALLALAFPDRIAQRRESGDRYLLRNGRGAAFSRPSALSQEPYLVPVELDDRGAEGRIYLAAPIDEEELEEVFAAQVLREEKVEWDTGTQSVRARAQTRLGALTLREDVLPNPKPDEILPALLGGVRTEGLGILPWSRNARRLRKRLGFMHRQAPEWPDVSDEALIETLPDWLGPYVYGLRSRTDLQSLDMTGILMGMLPWEQRRSLDEVAPTHITVPSGSRIPIDYSNPEAPVLAVRLQEMFGLDTTPRIAGGRVTLTLHLLSPAQRPVQVTQDLGSFWRNAYFEVKGELQGRYPKHYWPDDPLKAKATGRAGRPT